MLHSNRTVILAINLMRQLIPVLRITDVRIISVLLYSVSMHWHVITHTVTNNYGGHHKLCTMFIM